jgi:ketosteroid isomerase-like protein
MYHSRAHMLGGNMPIAIGRDAIQKAWQGFFDANFADLKLMTESVERHGDILVELGRYSATAGGKPDIGKYVVIYKKEGSAWKLWVDSFSSDAPPAP